MVVAQLLFGPEDRAWHLVTEGWHPGAQRRLHLSPADRVWLVPVPVLRWAEAGTLMRTVAELDDPAEVGASFSKLYPSSTTALGKNPCSRLSPPYSRQWLNSD